MISTDWMEESGGRLLNFFLRFGLVFIEGDS